MNLLTDKAKIDFLKYYFNSSERVLLGYAMFEDLPVSCQNALIIEWLDSVGFYINIKNYKFIIDWSYEIKQDRKMPVIMEDGEEAIKSRSEITKIAIEKANEIYNQK